VQTTQPDAPFSVDEHVSYCREINEASYEWALKESFPKTAARYRIMGAPMKFLDDVFPIGGLPVGPEWIDQPLHLVEKNGGEWLEVSSPAMPCCMALPGQSCLVILDSQGFHFCKLLSPARAMEWIYLDGLRYQGHL
jgi:hypothetical protein